MTLQQLQTWHNDKALFYRDLAHKFAKAEAPQSKVTGFHKTADFHEKASRTLTEACRIVQNIMDAS